MRLTRIYQDRSLVSGEQISLSADAAHHLVHVLRLTTNAEFILFNGEGGEFDARIVSAQKGGVLAQIGAFNATCRESSLQIILAQTLVKPDKMDYVLQKSVELGVTHIIPLITERCLLPKLSPERWEKRLAHWQAIMVNASEQSGRTQLPTVARAITLKKALMQIKADIRIILQPKNMQQAFQFPKSCYGVAVLVGPEGGWSDGEMRSAMEAGYTSLQLGPRVLRAETASVAALTLLQARYGDISFNLV